MADYQQRWLIYFDILDGNKSGNIDPADAYYSKPVFAKLLGVAEDDPIVKQAIVAFTKFFIELIRAFDTNKDNKVTKDELLKGVEKLFAGKTVAALPEWWKKNVDQFFNIVDKNKSGELSLEEVVGAIKRVNPEATDDSILAAREWAIAQGGSGKYDATAYSKAMFEWATSPKPTPEASLLLPQLSINIK